VPSEFVARSLLEAPGLTAPVHVVTFGSPVVPDVLADGPATSSHENLRILFVGSMGQRKGLADLFAAYNLLNRPDVELWVLGSPMMPMEFYYRECPRMKYFAPRPREQVFSIMRQCDVLVLPSLLEGRALVQQEAMACGLPLIVTPNAGAEDMIEEGRTGFLVPIRSPETLAEKFAWCCEHRGELAAMRSASMSMASRHRWAEYGRSIVDLIISP